MFRLLTAVILISEILAAAQGVSYVKYYLNEQDFLRGISMQATERTGVPHIRALYDKYDRLLSKANMDSEGNLVRENVYEYDDLGVLLRRSIRDRYSHVEKMYVYGSEEKMSKVFLAYAFEGRNLTEFKDRITVYEFDSKENIKGYRFLTVDNTELGSIAFKYFDSGLVKEERWVRQPGSQTVRLFRYDYDPKTRAYELTEYDSTGAEVSRVGLVLPVETDAMVGVPQSLLRRSEDSPPGTGSILEESTEIIQDIRKRKATGWDPSRELGQLLDRDLPNLPDLVYLRSGDTLKVELFQITDEYVRFKLVGEEDILTIPLSDVGEIERRDGRIVYPVIY